MLEGFRPQRESSGSIESLSFPDSRDCVEAVVQPASQLLLPSSPRHDRGALSQRHGDSLTIGNHERPHGRISEKTLEDHARTSTQRKTGRLRRKVQSSELTIVVAFGIDPLPGCSDALDLPIRPSSGSRTKRWQRQLQRSLSLKTQSRRCSSCSVQTGTLHLRYALPCISCDCA